MEIVMSSDWSEKLKNILGMDFRSPLSEVTQPWNIIIINLILWWKPSEPEKSFVFVPFCRSGDKKSHPNYHISREEVDDDGAQQARYCSDAVRHSH